MTDRKGQSWPGRGNLAPTEAERKVLFLRCWGLTESDPQYILSNERLIETNVCFAKEQELTEKQKKGAKERIMKASLSLFARKGYSGVGVREIAKSADVNVSMISYYFGGKAGILKAIVKEAFEKYYEAIRTAAPEDAPVEEHFRLIVHAVVKYFRQNAELGIVAFDVIPLDIPEILDYKVETALSMHKGMKPFHDKLGLDRTDPVQLSIFPRALIATVLMHFQALYAAQDMPMFKEQLKQMDDAFYKRYADTIADLFLHGMNAVFHPDECEKGAEDA